MSLKVDTGGLLGDSQPRPRLFQSGVRCAVLVVVPQVLERLELHLKCHGVSFRPVVGESLAGADVGNVRLAILGGGVK